MEKLTLEVKTTGSLTADEAVRFASQLLQSYFGYFGSDQKPVEPEFMTELLACTTEDGIFVPPGKEIVLRHAPIAAGTTVRILEGPYAGLLAQFARMKGIERSVILTTMFGRQCAIEIDREDIQPLELEAAQA